MPESIVVCPHCEKSVELPVTSVTRSRECPLCGKVIMLRVDSHNKGAALLISATEKADAMPDVETLGFTASENTKTEGRNIDVASENDVSPQGESVSPQVLIGDIRRRMMHDPEVLARIKTLQWGGSILGGVIVLVVVASFLHFWAFLGGLLMPTDKRDQLAKSDALLIPTGEMRQPAPKQEEETKAKTLTAQESHAPWRTAVKNEVQAVPLTDEARALQAGAAFLGAKNVEERLKLVRDVKLMEPKIRAYYAKHSDGPISFEHIEPQEKNPMGESTFGLSVVMPKGERRRMIVGLAKSGDFVVDWASFVLYAEMDWSEFIAQKPEAPKLFRVLAVQDVRFNDNFSDPKALVCLKLVDPRDPSAKPVWGYASRNTTLGRSLEFLFSGSLGESLPLMVGLKYEPLSASNDQVWISELVAQGWVARGK